MSLDHALDSLAARMTAAGRCPLGYRKNGAPIWPIFGAEDNPPADPPKNEPPKPTPPPDKGFPEGTPLEQMTSEQQANYWKHQAQKHQGRSESNYALLRSLGITSADDAQAVKDKIAKHDKLEYDLASEQEKAITDAKSEAATTAASQFVPQIVAARLDAAAARKGIDADALSKALEFVDHEKFLNDAGEIDTAKVQSFIDGIAPAKGNQQSPKGPSLTGHGPSGGGSGSGRERGLEEARKRFPELANQ